MRALGIETATSIASVGVVVDQQIIAEAVLSQRGNHARTVLPLIDQVLAGAGLGVRDLNLIAVSIGPGSFTGLRVGLSVAKGLVLATPAGLAPVPTLTAYAHAAGPLPGLVCPILDARKGEVYTASFRWRAGEPQCIAAPAVMTPERFAASLCEPCTLLGDGVDAHADLWRRMLGTSATLLRFAALPPSGGVVAQLGSRDGGIASDRIADLEPAYCRAPEAEVKRTRAGSLSLQNAEVWKN